MSSAAATAVKPPPHTTSTSEGVGNTFDDASDASHSDGEWWDEDEEEPTSNTPTAATAVRITQWPRAQETKTPNNSPKPPNRPIPQKSNARYSVQKPIRYKSKGRQRLQNAKAGIKVVTNFSNHQATTAPPKPVQLPQDRSQAGCFVDLAALEALNGGSSPAAAPAPRSFWKSRKAKAAAPVPNIPPQVPQAPGQASANTNAIGAATSGRSKPKGLIPSPLNLNEDLSPSDRPIVIGISIPSASLVKHTVSPLTASSYTSKLLQMYEGRTPTGNSPETPTIVITPARDGPAWSPLGYDGARIGHASSIYSQATHNPFGIYSSSKDAPPMPPMPASMLGTDGPGLAAQRSYFSPDSDQSTLWGDDDSKYGSPSKARITSTCTVFEEDDSPILTRAGRPRSISAATKDTRHESFNTVATRRSRGWWNYITTPFLTRSNTVTARGVFEDQQPPPALPSLAIASAKALEAESDHKSWAKQFSPITPATSTTINSDAWWDTAGKEIESREIEPTGLSPIAPRGKHIAQASSGTIPFVLSEVAAGTRGVTTSNAAANVEPQRSITMPTAPPAAVTRAVPNNTNPFVQPRLADLQGTSTDAASTIPLVVPPVRAANTTAQPSPPPPYTSSPPRRYRAILPPGNSGAAAEASNLQYPVSPGPVSPGLQEAISSRGGIPMSEVATPPAARMPINLNSGYPDLPPRGLDKKAAKKAQKAEAKRQRHEKEDAVARKAGGLWRGRGCVSNRGCYGRTGAEGRKKRRVYLGLIAAFLSVIVVAIVLATTLHRKSNTVVGPSQWLNLTGFPPIFTGLSTVATPVNSGTNTGCVAPSTQWSCSLPKEEQASVAPNAPNRPNFVLQIQWDNSSSANATFANVTGNPNLETRNFVGNPVSASHFIRHLMLKARQIVTFAPNPAPPSFAEESFLGSTTDGIVSADKAGEPTPFYISFLPTTGSAPAKREFTILPRASNSTDPFPDLGSIIPAPSLNPDGTAAAANLLPLPLQQPLRLYDRGLPSEHYGFYTYFDRSIFLKSISTPGDETDDGNGGATAAQAAFRCTWTQTRFLVQMWTRANSTTNLINGTTSSSLPAGQDFTQPGSFPYPITITTDRHGGDPALKMYYCYNMNGQGGLVATSGRINSETRGFGGTVINPAPSLFSNTSDPSLGGFDGGTGGCSCQWQNFQNVQ